MNRNTTNLEIMGKEPQFNMDNDFILDNWEFGPNAALESKFESFNPVFAVAMFAVLVMMILLAIIL